MAEKPEILMKLVQSGQAIAAECAATLVPPDDLMSDFDPGRYFEIEDFSFGVGRDFNDPADQAKWLNRRAGEAGPSDYSLRVEPVGFSRLMDQASTTLFKACSNATPFDSATIIRRTATGSDGGAKAYLRFDFTHLLLTELDWEEGQTIKEKYRFVCRAVKMQIKRQASEGTLGAAVPGVWPKT